MTVVVLDGESQDVPAEETPLLRGGGAREEATAHNSHYHSKFMRVAIIIVAAVFLAMIGEYMSRAPVLRLLEDVVCRSYYESAEPTGLDLDLSIPIPEEKCKLPWIQSELAMLKGWDSIVSCIPSLLLSVPYGMLADKHGRRFVLVLSLFGDLLSLIFGLAVIRFSNVIDYHWYPAANLFLAIGGGGPVTRAMLFAIFSDVAPEDRRAQVFSYITAASYISTLVAIPLSWQLMKMNSWVPMLVVLGFNTFGTILVSFLPETLERSKFPDELIDSELSEPSSENGRSATLRKSTQSKITQGVHSLQDILSIFNSPLILGLSFTFLLQIIHPISLELAFQLSSERFNWKLTNASFLFPISAVTAFLVLVVALPAIYRVLSTRYNMSTMAKDLIVIRGSLVLYILGALAIALGFTPGLFVIGTMIYACGDGFPPAQRSLVTALVHPDEVSRLYTVLGVVETLGRISFGFFLPKAFGWGLRLGGLWSGMPFLVCATLFLVVGLPIWVIGENETRVELDVHGDPGIDDV